VSITLLDHLEHNASMKEKEKPSLQIVGKEDDLTIKQRKFVDAIVKGTFPTYKEAYFNSYDVTPNKNGSIPKWVEVEASRLLSSNPKITQSIRKALERKEDHAVASSIRTRSYVLERLYKESTEADSSASRIRSLELLGKSVALFSDVVETKEARQSTDIEADIEEKIKTLLDRED